MVPEQAALFRPVRNGVRDVVDRRFNWTRYDAERTLAEFAQRLRDEVELEALRADLVGTAVATVAPTHAGTWLPRPPVSIAARTGREAGPSALATGTGPPQRPA
jgi:hypothetical protein